MKNIILSENFTDENKLKVLGKGSSNGIDTTYFDPDNYSDNDIKYAMNSLNDRPRKRLEFFTPNELFLKKRVAFNCWI